MSAFAYGDSSRTGDDKYVLAQLRSDATLSWVVDLRSYLNLPELKYKFFQPHIFRVQSKRDLWKNVQEGVYQAEITITDPRVYQEAVILDLLEQQAEFGIDFDLRTVNEEASHWMIARSPLSLAESVTMDFAFEISDPGAGISFTSGAIRERAGGKLNDAIVVSARAHAMLSPAEAKEIASIKYLSGGMNYGLALAKIARLSRMWDVEHPKSLPILNEFSERIAYIAAGHGVFGRRFKSQPFVTEGGSHSSDHLQAADMAAGWAANLLTLSGGDYRSLAQKFATVCVNGVTYPG
ncbi:MAG: hypothetical protein WA405_00125 [Candidatus Acidiferrales bacterium]